MRVHIEKVNSEEQEQVLIQCMVVNQEVKEITDFIKSKDNTLTGYENSQRYHIALQDIYYFEGVDNKVYAYLHNHVYEIKNKLYELEESHKQQKFFRCSKSILVNLLKIEYVKPALNGRFTARLINGEQIIISRQYVPALKQVLQI